MQKVSSLIKVLNQRVNELYHDFANEMYHSIHRWMFEQDSERWERVGRKFLHSKKYRKILDIGTGSGLVPLTMAKFFKKDEIFVCSDISRRILDLAENNLKSKNFQCMFKFVKLESQVPFQLPFETESFDIVTMNSVLHHINDTETFLGEIDRILKSNGLLFIGHEPNLYFYNHRFLWVNYKIINHVEILLRSFIRRVLYFFKVRKKATIIKIREQWKIVFDKINETLLKDKIIKRKLNSSQIRHVMELAEKEGFKPDLLLPKYQLTYFETYNHLFWIYIRNAKNKFITKYEKLLRRKYPKNGANFFAIYKKS